MKKRLNINPADPVESAMATADAAWIATDRAERAWLDVASVRGPDDWLRAVDGVKKRKVRLQVANIVWWDFFSQRVAADRWPQLDKHIAEWRPSHNAPIEHIRDGLRAVGYPGRLADRRVRAETLGECLTKRAKEGAA